MSEPLDTSNASSRRRIVARAASPMGQRLARVAGRGGRRRASLFARWPGPSTPGFRLVRDARPRGPDGFRDRVATHGYPLSALTEHLRIARGVGVLGSVYQSGVPLWVTDVSDISRPGAPPPALYRTNSFIALPHCRWSPTSLGSSASLIAGMEPGRSHATIFSALRAAGQRLRRRFALARERARGQADSFYAHAAGSSIP